MISHKEAKELLMERFKSSNMVYTDMFGHTRPISEDISNVSNTLTCIPAGNLNSLLDNFGHVVIAYRTENKDKDKPLSFDAFMQTASRMGLLVFTPHIVEDKNNHPTLVLKYNRYLHLFRGHYFQVSYTVDGIGSYSTSGIRLDGMIDTLTKVVKVKGEFVQMLVYLSAIKAAWELDVFRDLVEKHVEVFDEFIHKTLTYMKITPTLSYNDILEKVLQKDTGCLRDRKYCAVYRIPKTDTADYARLAIYDENTIVLRKMIDGKECCYVFDFSTPFGWDLGAYHSAIYEEYEDDPASAIAEFHESYLKSESILMTKVAFVLNVSGFISNFMVTYPINKNMPTLRAMDARGIQVLDKLDDVVTFTELLNPYDDRVKSDDVFMDIVEGLHG